LIGVYQRME